VEVSFGNQILHCEDLEQFDFSTVDIVLMSAGGSISAAWGEKIGAAGPIVIDNSSHFRMDPDVPLVVPEVNPDAVDKLPKNIIANPKIGIIFMIPGANDTYRVNGNAHISVDPALLARFEVRGKPPRAVMVVAVEEAFNHCPKAFVRAKLWQSGADGRPENAPTLGSFAAFRDGADEAYAAKYDDEYAERMPKQLY